MHIALGRAVAMAFGVILWLMMARLLMPSDYGTINYLISIAMLVSIATGLGLTKTIMTYYPKEGKENLISGSIMLVLLSSSIAAILVTLWEPLLGVLIFGLSLFSLAVHVELGRRMYKRYMWLWAGAKILVLPFSISMYLVLGLPGFLLGYVLPPFILALVSLRRVNWRANPRLREIRTKIGFASKAWIVELMTGSSWLLDKVLIGFLFGMAILGTYYFAYQVYMLLSLLPLVLFTFLLPEKSAGVNTKKVESLGLQLSIVLAVAALVLAPLLLPWIFPNFVGSIRSVQIMALAVIPATLAMIKMSQLYASERPGAVLISYTIAVSVGIIGIIFLGRYFGTIGLAVSMVFLQVTLAISTFLYTKRGSYFLNKLNLGKIR